MMVVDVTTRMSAALSFWVSVTVPWCVLLLA